VQNSPNPVLIAGPQGRLAMLNPAAQEWFGMNPEGEPPLELSILFPFMAGEFPRLFNGELTVLKAEGTVRTRHAGERVVEVTASTVMLQDERIAHAVMVRDVSADRALTQSLRESKEALAAYSRRLEAAVSERTAALRESNTSLREANAQLVAETREKDRVLRQLQEAQAVLLQSEKMAALGQLAAGVAHEINNPMGFVYSNLNSLREYFTTIGRVLDLYAGLDGMPFPPDTPAARLIAQVKEYKRKMEFDYVMQDCPNVIADSLDGAARVVAIVQNLKDFSRVDSREKEWANLNAGLESTLKIIWNELKYKVEIEKDYGDIGEVECYPQQLNQVFLNLLVNAAQAIETSGKISIRTWKEEGGVAVEIRDNGCGIPPQHLGRIFDPFFTTKPAGKGTGLGLSVVYSIIRQHHGRIEVESEPGKGTRFVVHVPTRSPAPDPPRAPL
jgi:signal transduction histidine kinase